MTCPNRDRTPDGDAAINDPAIRSALRRYTRNAVGLVVLALALLAATWVIGSAGYGMQEMHSSLWSNAPALTLLPIAAVVVLSYGGGGLVNCTRIRRTLSRRSWERKRAIYQMRAIQSEHGQVKSSFVSFDVNDERVSFVVLRPRRTGAFNLAELDFAGTSGGGVITDPGHSVLAWVGQRKRAERSLVRDTVVDPGKPVEKFEENDARLRIRRED